MVGSLFNLESTRSSPLAGTCLCHGESAEMHAKRGAGSTPALISAATIRPLVDLALAGMLREQRSVPSWTQNPHMELVPLVIADRWVEEVSFTLREPALGLMALSAGTRGIGDVVEFAAERAETLVDALLVMARFMSGVNDAASIHLHISHGSAILAIGSQVHLSRVMRDYLVGAIALLVSRWLDPSVKLALWLSGPRPSHALAYRRPLGEIPISFYAPCDALVLPAGTLSAPMPLADVKLHDFLLTVARQLPRTRARASHLLGRVERPRESLSRPTRPGSER